MVFVSFKMNNDVNDFCTKIEGNEEKGLAKSQNRLAIVILQVDL
jgi:hypothetical protein